MSRLKSAVLWICLFFSSTFFLGFLPGKIMGKSGKWGGTMGTAVAMVAQSFLWWRGVVDADIQWGLVCLVALVGAIVVDPAEGFMLRKWGPQRRHTGEMATKDYTATCIDEVLGMLIAGMPVWYMVPAGHWSGYLFFGIAFVFFRIFDASKFGPVGVVEKDLQHTHWLGVMTDDAVAGVLAAVATAVCTSLLLPFVVSF